MDDFSNDGKVEITLKGNASAIGDILTGNFARLLEDKSDVQRELERVREERDGMQSKLWKAEWACSAAKEDLERSNRLVRERNEEIAEQKRQLAFFNAKLDELGNKMVDDLTDDQNSALAAAREKLFQELLSSVTFPDNKPKPRTLGELMSFFVFPIFQAGNAPAGWSPGQAVGTPSGVTNKIAMIKQVRELTGVGLKEAKNFIEGRDAGLLK